MVTERRIVVRVGKAAKKECGTRLDDRDLGSVVQ
jgi:hypothetical protein